MSHGSPGGAQRFDERDTVFARMARRAGTPEYEDYYSRRPELRKADDRLRSLPALGCPGGRHYHPEISAEAERYFEDIPGLEPDPAVVARGARELEAAEDPASAVKALALELGAVAVGCALVDPAFVYTHKGRHDADYGREVSLHHPHAIVFLVEMDFDAMQRAPRAETLRESARQYRRGAVISKTVVAVLEACGCEARSHHDAHYDVILPPLAVRAGLGELGRHNILIADRFGTRVRIGAVTTTPGAPPGFPLSEKAFPGFTHRGAPVTFLGSFAKGRLSCSGAALFHVRAVRDSGRNAAREDLRCGHRWGTEAVKRDRL